MELWDAYTAAGEKLGFDLIRGEEIPPAAYHLVAEIYTVTEKGELLLTQRHPAKTWPMKWENNRRFGAQRGNGKRRRTEGASGGNRYMCRAGRIAACVYRGFGKKPYNLLLLCRKGKKTGIHISCRMGKRWHGNFTPIPSGRIF